jgi:hypothetical protein
MLYSLKDHERLNQGHETLLTVYLNAVIELGMVERLDIEENNANDIHSLHTRLPSFEQLRRCLNERLDVISTDSLKAIDDEKEKHFSTMSFVDFCFQLYGRDGYFKKHENKALSEYAMQIFKRLSEYTGQHTQWQRMKRSIIEILENASVTLSATGQPVLAHPLMEKEEALAFDPVEDRMRKLDRLGEMQSLIAQLKTAAPDHFYDRSYTLFTKWLEQIISMLSDYQAFLSGAGAELYRDWRRYHHEQPFLERSLAQIACWRNAGIISLRDRVWPEHIQSLQLTASDLNSYQKNAFVHWSDVTEDTIFDDLMGVYNLMMRTGHNAESDVFDRDGLYHVDKLNSLLESELAIRVKDGFSPILDAMKDTLSPLYGETETSVTRLLVEELQTGEQAQKSRAVMNRLLDYGRGRPFNVRLKAWRRIVGLYEHLQKDYIFVANSYRRYDEGLRTIILKAFEGDEVQAFSNVDQYHRVTVQMEVRALQWIADYFETHVDWIYENIGGHYLARANYLIRYAQEHLNAQYNDIRPAVAHSIMGNGYERNGINLNNLHSILLAG